MLYIFDWDGTLSNSEEKIIYCMQRAAESIGVVPCSGHDIRNIIGLGLPEAIRVLHPNIPVDDIAVMQKSYSTHFLTSEHLGIEFFDGVLSTLKKIKEAGFMVAIATGKSRRGLDRVLESLELTDFFHASRCADETASKPNPLMLHELLDEFNVSVNDAVMVGDTEWDMAMAQKINMPRIAVTYGAHTKERLLGFEPDLCVDQFADILAWKFTE